MPEAVGICPLTVTGGLSMSRIVTTGLDLGAPDPPFGAATGV